MDIQMRFMDGMTAAQKIREADPEVILIFLTSMAGYAIKGYEVDALDYILKPVSYEIFSMMMTLEDDMCTLKTQPRKLLPVLGKSGGTGFEGHEFFEASSIGKIRGRYYLVYSSVALHELCYAVSDHPDRDFRYGGVIVSNCDLFPGKAGNPLNCYGNDHGGLECIDGIYYIFYHRQTNRTMFSRQGCAEKVEILEDGSIPQTELTSCGLNGGPLMGEGTYSAAICCNLYGRMTPVISSPFMFRFHPYLTQDGPDWSPGDAGRPPMQYIANGKDGMAAAYKYFRIEHAERISVRVRGRARGKLLVRTEPEGPAICEIPVKPAGQWTEYSGRLRALPGAVSLCFCYKGRGRLDFAEFSFS